MKATFWDKRSKHYDDNIKKHDALYVKTIDSTKSLLTDSDVVLDFACASGEMSLDIAPHVQEVIGIDLSVKMIELANQKARDRQVDNINFDQADVFDQRLVNNSFSAIIAFSIFHLVDDIPPCGSTPASTHTSIGSIIGFRGGYHAVRSSVNWA